jgi:PilZ domain
MSVHGFGATMPERRRTPRTSLDEIVYVDMGPGNGGVVLNVSEGGLAFCAAVPIREPGVIQFSLLVKGKGRIASSADVMWTDKKQKTCGLRFTPSFEQSGVLLRHWTDASYCPSRTWDETLSSNPHVEVPVFAARTDVSAPPRTTKPAAVSPIPPASKPERGPFDPITGEDLARMRKGMSTPAATFLRVTAAIFLVAGLILGAVVLGKGAEDSHIEATTDRHASRTRQSTGRSLATPLTVAAPLPEAGQSDLVAALEYLRPPGQPDTTSATRLLQSAVKSGNSSAGVFLAEMYLSGEGVRKNCTDAGALLTAASKNGNIEASVKLKELVVKGCR